MLVFPVKLKKLVETPLTNVNIEGTQFIIDCISDKSSYTFPIFFGKLATMSGLLLKLDNMLNDYNKLYGYLTNNPTLLLHDEAAGYDLVGLWKDIFKAKKTQLFVF